jgi:Flp pilus assembly protein TadD
MGRWITSWLLFAVLATGAPKSSLERARDMYQATDYAGAIALLKQMPPKDAAAWALLGRSQYMAGNLKEATSALENAVAIEPNNAGYHHWLGQAWGRRAETSAWVTAIQYARKTRDSFERAVSLDPHNMEAVNDLFEYYIEAPGFLGGGVSKAEGLLPKIKATDEVEYHYAAAKLAEKRKEYGAAEEQLRRASEMAPKQVGRVIDLAKFLAKQGKFLESDDAFQRAQKLDPNNPKLMFEKAKTLIETKRNPAEARRLLEKYMQSALTPDDPSKDEARKLLNNVRGS